MKKILILSSLLCCMYLADAQQTNKSKTQDNRKTDQNKNKSGTGNKKGTGNTSETGSEGTTGTGSGNNRSGNTTGTTGTGKTGETGTTGTSGTTGTGTTGSTGTTGTGTTGTGSGNNRSGNTTGTTGTGKTGETGTTGTSGTTGTGTTGTETTGETGTTASGTTGTTGTGTTGSTGDMGTHGGTTQNGDMGGSMVSTGRYAAMGVRTGILHRKDAKFMVMAASSNSLELRLSELALQRASSQAVKDFAAMMVKHHTMAAQEMKDLLSRKGAMVPDTALLPMHRTQMDMVMAAQGAAFDKAYMRIMVDAHEEDVDEYEDEVTDARDADIRAFAARMMPTLQTHYQQSKEVRKQVR